MKTNNPELTHTALMAAALLIVAIALAGRFNIVHISEAIQVTLLVFGLVMAALTNAVADYTRPRRNTRTR